ncbi:hypothetical protein O988_06816 [Pseudogymnoascus sp. VKM F-3808]|nr:hypothetical protein O988_06816 [Pseudogymnoascus sp. VKM F-3808]
MLFPLAIRAQAVTLKNCGYSYENIEKLTGIKQRQLQTESPTSEAQSEEERDVDMTTTPSTLDQTTSGESVLDQLHAAAAGEEYAAPNSPQTASNYTPPSEQ